MTSEQRIQRLFNNWLNKTEGLLIQQLKKHNIGITNQLRNSLMHELHMKGKDYFEGDITMLSRGRFVDMNVGRGRPLIGSSRRSSLEGKRGSKPRRWYSRTLWGRLYDLHGAIGYQMVEQAVESIKTPIKKA